jgi:hypothetical protein
MMKLLDDVGYVESNFSWFGDSVTISLCGDSGNLDAR